MIFNEYPLSLEHCPREKPGTYFGMSTAGGLGWGLGAALGAKLAAPDELVVATLGDGTYMFTNPTVSHWVGDKHKLPVLTIIFNNSRYGAVRRATLSMFKDGVAGEDDGRFLADLDPSPAYDELMEAQGGFGARVEKAQDLPGVLAGRATPSTARRKQALAQRDPPGLSSDEQALEHPVMLALRAAIVLTVVAWVLNIHGRLQIALYTEQMLVAVLGLALALTFLTFPFGARESGEEAVGQGGAACGARGAQAALLDWMLAALSLAPASTSRCATRS